MKRACKLIGSLGDSALNTSSCDLGIEVGEGSLQPLTEKVVALVQKGSVQLIDLEKKRVEKVDGEWLSFSGGVVYLRLAGRVGKSSLTLFDVKGWTKEENKYHTSSAPFLRAFTTKEKKRITVSGNAVRLWDGNQEVADLAVTGLGEKVKGAGLHGDMVYFWRSEAGKEQLDACTINAAHTNRKTIFNYQTGKEGTEYIFGKDHIFTLNSTDHQGFELACYQPTIACVNSVWTDKTLEKGSDSVKIGFSLFSSLSSWYHVNLPSFARWAGEDDTYGAFTVSKGDRDATFKTVLKASGNIGDILTYDPTEIKTPILLPDGRVIAWKNHKIVELKKGDAPLNKMSLSKQLTLLVAGILVVGVLTRMTIRYLKLKQPQAFVASKPATSPLEVTPPPMQPQWVPPSKKLPRGPLSNPHHFMNRGETW